MNDKKYKGFLFEKNGSTSHFICAVDNQNIDQILDSIRKPLKDNLGLNSKTIYELYIEN